MTHRERLVAALKHQPTDRVPMDLGSTRVSSISVAAYERLKCHFGVQRETRLIDMMQQVVRVDEEILKALDVDTRIVLPGKPDKSRDEILPDGRWQDEWGVVRQKPEGGFYYDLVQAPLSDQTLGREPTEKDLDDYPWPDAEDPGRFRGLRKEAQGLREETDCAIVGHAQGGWVHIAQYVRGFEGWYTDLITRPSFAYALMERILSLTLHMAESFLREVGEYLDVVATGDDVAVQSGPMVSPGVYRKLIWPLHKRQFTRFRELTSAKLFYHSCGSVYSLLPDLVELGVDIINPVQVSAKDMDDTARLKREFGDRLCFWGGVDTFRVMPHGTVDEVKSEVERRIRDLAVNGGYVLNAVHNIQPDVPVENILAMYEHGRTVLLSA